MNKTDSYIAYEKEHLFRRPRLCKWSDRKWPTGFTFVLFHRRVLLDGRRNFNV